VLLEPDGASFAHGVGHMSSRLLLPFGFMNLTTRLAETGFHAQDYASTLGRSKFTGGELIASGKEIDQLHARFYFLRCFLLVCS
jgi:hypothetical protein